MYIKASYSMVIQVEGGNIGTVDKFLYKATIVTNKHKCNYSYIGNPLSPGAMLSLWHETLMLTLTMPAHSCPSPLRNNDPGGHILVDPSNLHIKQSLPSPIEYTLPVCHSSFSRIEQRHHDSIH